MLARFFSFFSIIIFTINTFCVYSQVIFDTIVESDTLQLKKITVENWILNNEYEDSENESVYSLENFQRYKLLGKDFPLLSLGNIGTPYYEFDSYKREYSKSFFVSTFRNYFTEERINYSVNRPFTSLYYTNGYKKEQLFNVFHTQNFSHHFNFHFHFNKINSVGVYKGQNSDVTGVVFSVNYKTKNKRYGVVLTLNSQKIKVKENGGIKYLDDLYDKNIDNSELIETNLDISNASNKIEKQGLLIIQQVNFFKSFSDSSINPLYRLSFLHEIDIGKSIKVYHDEWPQSGFYDNVLMDSLISNDSIAINPVSNTLRLTYNIDKNNNLFLLGNYEIWNHFQNSLIDTVLSNISIETGWQNSLEYLKLSAKIKRVISGYNAGDLFISSEVKLKNRKGEGYFSFDIKNEESPYYFKRFYSNHFEWNFENFIKRNIATATIGYKFKLFSIYPYVKGFKLKNTIYFDEYAIPRQYLYDIYIMNVGVSAKLKFWRFNIYPTVFYQNVSEEQILPMPNIVGITSFFYSSRLFKSTMELQLGADIFYYSDYFGYDYMPSTSVFYLQNNYLLGNYPYIDLFLNLKVKRMKFFMKYEHINEGLSGYNYMFVPNYPNSGRALRVGIWWGFLN